MTRDEQIALYQAMGFDLLPTRGGPEPDNSKRPIEGITWQPKVKYNRKAMTRQGIAELFAERPESNIGILTGDRSGLAVIDIDTGQDIEQARKVLSSLSLPEDTTTVTTGRGLHFWYKTTGQVKSGRTSGYEIKGNGTYAIAPPSIHWKGKEYIFLPGRGLEVIKAVTLPGTVTRPVTLQGPDTNAPGRTAGEQGKVVRLPGQGLLSGRIRSFAIRRGLDCVKQILDRPLVEGERRDGLFMLYSLMVNNRDDKEWARRAVEQKNSELKTPLTNDELQAAVFSGRIYRHKCVTIKSKLPFIDCGNCDFIDTQGEQMLSGLKANKLAKDDRMQDPDFRAWYFIQTGQVDLDRTPQKELAHFFRVRRQAVRGIIDRLTAGGYINRDRKLF